MLIFDFDGVLMDSLDETLVSGYNAVSGKSVTTLDAIPETVVRRFRQNRFHVRTSDELFVLMEWCVAVNRGPTLLDLENGRLDRSGLEAMLRQSSFAPSERSARFFEARREFMAADRKSWIALHRPFQPIWDELAHPDREPAILLTSKNRAAVLALCAHFGLAMPPENVYSGDDGTSKTANLKAIHHRFNSPRYRFIDDSLGNLQRLDADFNGFRRFIDLILAGWGYVGPEDAAEAERLGYRVVPRSSVASLTG